MILKHDVPVIQLIKSSNKYDMTTHYKTPLLERHDDICEYKAIFMEILSTLKAIKSHLKDIYV